jgi:aspartate-semialdehyde dehydrogenase
MAGVATIQNARIRPPASPETNMHDSSLPLPRPLPSPLNVAIVGATGAVGHELVRCLNRRGFPLAGLKLLASARSAGRALVIDGERYVVEALDDDSFEGCDVAFFSAGASVSRRYGPVAVAAGCRVIDNSSAFRMDPDIPLTVPEVNGESLAGDPRLIANPNCTAAIASMALGPIHRKNPICRVIASTYQAASGAGAAAMQELLDATAAALAGETFTPKVMPHPYGFNLFSHNSAIDPVTGYNDEEAKVMDELRKILAAPELRIGVTCVRVPVPRAHSIALTVECERPVSPAEVEIWLAEAPGVEIVNDLSKNHFPMPVEASGRDAVLAGRFRRDLSDPSGHTVCLFVAGDQLLKGAALNAVQIAEALHG